MVIQCEPQAQLLLEKAGVQPDEGTCDLLAIFIEEAPAPPLGREPKVPALAYASVGNTPPQQVFYNHYIRRRET